MAHLVLRLRRTFTAVTYNATFPGVLAELRTVSQVTVGNSRVTFQADQTYEADPA